MAGATSPESPRLRVWLLAAMAGCVALALALSVWDEARESAAALDDFAREQAGIAAGVAAEVSARLATPAATPATNESNEGARRTFFDAAARVARPGAVLVLAKPAEAPGFANERGDRVAAAAIDRALASGHDSTWLDRAEAVQLGLPARRAAVGLAHVDGPRGRLDVAVVTTAEPERLRERRAELRLVASVVFAAGLVFLFGAIDRRRERNKLALERELALAAAERERDGDLAQASRAATLGTLAMGIAHEVSTPLGVIAGRAEQLLGRADEDDRNARAARAILEESERIRVIVRGFLDLARGGPPALAPVDTRAVVADAVDLVRHRFAKAGVAIETPSAPDSAEILGDPSMLRQAIANLLLNACQASAAGNRVEAAIVIAGERVAIVVRDEGVGIPPEAAARAVEPFFTTKPVGVGTGLGLAIANEIVKLHRGSLTIGPRDPRGTVATIELPRRTSLDRAA